jgi:alpha-L-rhamnosidase
MAEVVGVSVGGLSVERRADPIGIDALQPRFAWRLMGDGPRAWQTAYQLQVVDMHDPAFDTDDPAASWSTPTWDSGRVESADSTYVAYGSRPDVPDSNATQMPQASGVVERDLSPGLPLQSRHRYSWKVRVWDADGVESAWSAPAAFEMGLLAPADWSARWIAHVVPDLSSEPEEIRGQRPAPMLVRRFSLSGVPRRARLYITALGLYEASINGARVGDERLAPGWTDYNVRIQYQTYDVTPLLQAGDNVLAVRLGNGWYAGNVGAWGSHRYGDAPALLCQLESQSASGEMLTVTSDDQWVAQGSGTWLHDLQMGERTDLRFEFGDWGAVAFANSGWDPVSLRAAPGSRLIAARDDGIQVVQVLPGLSVRAADPDRHIVDLGANGAGVLRLRTAGTPGQHVVIRHAEALDADGELYTENLRGAEQQDEFILADSEPVNLEPRFTFHGFRYAEVSGVSGIAADDVESHVLSSATRAVGAFSCSDPLVDKLQQNIITSLRANFISVPTDCPQRNERLGWTADLQIFGPTALFNADLTNMVDKWLDDLVDTQLPSGAYADIAPAPSGWAGSGNTAWSDAGVIVPWVIYERSGDAGVLDRMYDSMRRYMAFLEADHTHGLRFAGRYGDWVSLGARTDKVFIGTAYLAYVADLFARIAALVGKSQDELHSRAFAERVREAFERRFVDGDGRLVVETQTAYAMALGFGLLPEGARPAAGERLAELVHAADTHLATGFLGTPLVLPALSDNGQHELACRLLRQDTYPSWLFEVRQGATSIWERWNGWTPEQGFYSPRMNSFNHYAFGAVGDWMYRYLGGLNPVEPGYRRCELRPRPGGGFTSARATHESLYGAHACGWRIQDGKLRVDAQVPANTSATVVLPIDSVDGVLLNGRLLSNLGGVQALAGEVRIDVPPGRHTVDAPYR